MTCTVMQGVLGDLQEQLPDVPLKMLQKQYRRALQHFARQAKVWRQADLSLKVFAGTSTYQLSAEQGAQVVEVVDIFRTCGCRNTKIPQVRTLERGYRACGCGANSWHEPESGLLVFSHDFKVDECLRVDAIIAPSQESEAFPPALLERYRDAIEFLTLARLLKMPNQVWTDFNLAAYHENQGQQVIDQAFSEFRNDMLPDRPTWGCC